MPFEGKIYSADFNALKQRVKTDLLRRDGNTNVSSFGGAAYDYSIVPAPGVRILQEHYTKIRDPLAVVNDTLVPSAGGNRKILSAELQQMDARIAVMEGESRTSAVANTCKSACTGMCVTSCSTTCRGSCVGGCSGCGGACSNNCSGGCEGGCTNNCTASCGGCGHTCTATCANSCTIGCGPGTCTGSCSGACGSGCSGTCTGVCTTECASGCSTGCAYSCGSGCSGACRSNASCSNCAGTMQR